MRYSEFIRIGDNIFEPPIDVIDKIIKNFMVPLNEMRGELGQAIYIRSCYRPPAWEKIQGRDGDSQHCFRGEGACDVSLTPNSSRGALGWKELFMLLDREYGRICWYPKEKFFHCDQKGHQKLYFINDSWDLTDRESLLEAIPD